MWSALAKRSSDSALDSLSMQHNRNPKRRRAKRLPPHSKIWSGREAGAPLRTPRSQAVSVLPG